MRLQAKCENGIEDVCLAMALKRRTQPRPLCHRLCMQDAFGTAALRSNALNLTPLDGSVFILALEAPHFEGATGQEALLPSLGKQLCEDLQLQQY